MGSCISSSFDHLQPAATVISSSGHRHRFETPVTVSEVLHHLSLSSLSKTSFFLTNSDSLSYENSIPAMSSNEELIDNQIYFVFPVSNLNRPLSASQMASLAVTASQALSKGSEISLLSLSGKNVLKKPVRNSRRVKSEISPYVEKSGSEESGYEYNYATVKRGGIERSSSLRKIQKYSSKRAKLAVRSFRLKLSTIHEGSTVQFLDFSIL